MSIWKIGSDVIRCWDYKHRKQPEVLEGIDYKTLSDGTVYFPSISQFLAARRKLFVEEVLNVEIFASDFILYHKKRITERVVYIPAWKVAILHKFLQFAVKDPDSAIKIIKEVSYREPETLNAMIDAMEAVT